MSTSRRSWLSAMIVALFGSFLPRQGTAVLASNGAGRNVNCCAIYTYDAPGRLTSITYAEPKAGFYSYDIP